MKGVWKDGNSDYSLEPPWEADNNAPFTGGGKPKTKPKAVKKKATTMDSLEVAHRPTRKTVHKAAPKKTKLLLAQAARACAGHKLAQRRSCAAAKAKAAANCHKQHIECKQAKKKAHRQCKLGRKRVFKRCFVEWNKARKGIAL